MYLNTCVCVWLGWCVGTRALRHTRAYKACTCRGKRDLLSRQKRPTKCLRASVGTRAKHTPTHHAHKAHTNTPRTHAYHIYSTQRIEGDQRVPAVRSAGAAHREGAGQGVDRVQVYCSTFERRSGRSRHGQHQAGVVGGKVRGRKARALTE